MPSPIVVQVVVDKPLAQGFDYLWDEEVLGGRPEVGRLVEVPFGRSLLVGMIIKVSAHSDYELDKLKEVTRVAPMPPLDPAALRLVNFASQYYIHALGETIIPTIPQMWKKPDDWEKDQAQANFDDGFDFYKTFTFLVTYTIHYTTHYLYSF